MPPHDSARVSHGPITFGKNFFDEEILMKELLQSSAKLKCAANISYNLASKLTDLIELRRALQRAEEAAAHRKATGTKQIVDRHRPR